MSQGEPTRLLLVDDDDSLSRAERRMLERHGYECDCAADAGQAVSLLKLVPYDLVLADVNMPGHSGLWLAEHVIRNYPDTPVVMVTGVDDPSVACRAVELGAYGYVIKPFEPNEIVISVANALRRRQLEQENRCYRHHLEELVAERTANLEMALQQLSDADAVLRRAHEEAIQRLAHAAEYHDPTTGIHLHRMSRVSESLARGMNLPAEHCELIRLASPMHDVGKIAIADTILRKPGTLDPDEWKEMRKHPEIGHALLADSESDLLRLAADIALTHHEKWNGEGYPRGVAGTAIPLEGRIVAVADVFDALTSDRPYKPAFSFDRAVDIVSEERGRHFDPEVVEVFLDLAVDLEVLGAQPA